MNSSYPPAAVRKLPLHTIKPNFPSPYPSIGPMPILCVSLAVADLEGRGTPPPLGHNFFIFMQFSGKIGQIVCWLLLLWEILDPPLVKVSFFDKSFLLSNRMINAIIGTF